MLNTILGIKKQMAQMFLSDGQRIPVTVIQADPCLVTQVKTPEKDGYRAIQVGLGEKKQTKRAMPGHGKKGIKVSPRFLRELEIEEEDKFSVGDVITADKLLQPGDLVNITGTSRGKGFTGVVKRWGFKGGPRTHGQSDRERAPGSIGQTTTPGRVYKGKKMAGRAGGATVTVRNLTVVKVEQTGEIWVTGQVPGIKTGLLIVRKVGENKRFPGLYEEEKEQGEKPEKKSEAEEMQKGEGKADAKPSR